MNREKAKKLIINTAIAGIIAGAGLGCGQEASKTKTGKASAEPTAVTKNGCSGKNASQGTSGEAKSQEAPKQGGDTNTCRATGGKKGAGEKGSSEKNTCAGKAGCAST